MAANYTITASLPLWTSEPQFSRFLALPSQQTVLTTVAILIPIHLVLVHIFRNHFSRQLYHRYPYCSKPNASQKPLSEMPLSAAHEILRTVSGKDFPYMFNFALQFALVRTYAIPTITHLLTKTLQLASPTRNTVGKRYADTAVILTELYHNRPGSTRSSEAFARLNYLHGHYIRQHKISNDDMLYVLALFLLHPIEWINRHEWRQLTELEITGLGVFHRFMGEAMEIDMTPLDHIAPAPLPNSSLSPTRTWRTDGHAFYTSLATWTAQYEARAMLPDAANHALANKTISLLQSTLPSFLHTPVSNTLIALMDAPFRAACLYPTPPQIYTTLANSGFAIRAFLIRNFFLPRRAVWGWWVPEQERANTTEYTSKDGRRWMVEYDALPHYVRPTVWNRWGPMAWVAWGLGVPVPGDQGMCGEGWRMGEVGPEGFKGKGAKDGDVGRRRLEGRVEVERAVREGGCPMFVKV